MNITICGGGNLGHVCTGYFGSNNENKVSLLTTRPERWGDHVEAIDPEGKIFRGKIARVSSSAAEVIPDADLVLACLPGFAIHDVLQSIAPYLKRDAWVGSVVSSTGFFFEAMKLLPKEQVLFGFQRVPFISRIIDYGHRAELKGYKESLGVAVEHTSRKEEVRQTIERLFGTPTTLLDSYYAVSLSNSNPLLHTSRLYDLWKEWHPGMFYDRQPLFYSDWTVEASELLIKMDEEFMSLLDVIGLKKGAIMPILDYYESADAESLTRKIRSIPAFMGILSPMVAQQEGKYAPDFSSRYFTEDFPYGMRFIVETAEKYEMRLPTIQHVYGWGMDSIRNHLASSRK